MSAPRWTLGLLVTTFLFAGCVTREDIRGLQTDMYNIQQGLETRLGGVKDQTDSVQTSQADLSADIRTLSQNLAALQAELQDSREQMKALSQRLDDLESTLTARMDAQIELLSGSKFVEKPLPSTVFNLANTDYSRGKDQEALKGFESYIRQFPKGEQVPEAKLKIGDILLKQKKNVEAIQVFDDLLKDYPKNAVAPKALLRKGKAYEDLGKDSAAIKVYELLVKTSPYTPEAKSAQGRLSELQNKAQ